MNHPFRAVKAHSFTVTFISFNYAERMTSEQGFCTHWDMAPWHISRRVGGWLTPLYPPKPCTAHKDWYLHLPPFIHRLMTLLISPSSLSHVSGTAGVVPGARILQNINQEPLLIETEEDEGQTLMLSSALCFLTLKDFIHINYELDRKGSLTHSPWLSGWVIPG